MKWYTRDVDKGMESDYEGWKDKWCGPTLFIVA